MARIRTIKPEYWSDERVTECSLSAQLLFIATWNFADDAGNLERSAKQLKARAFPTRDIDCEPLIVELLTQNLLREYLVDDKIFLHIQNFNKHQLINRPSKPICPDFTEDSLITHGVLTEDSLQEGKGGVRNGKDKTFVQRVEPKKTNGAHRGTRLAADWGLETEDGKWAEETYKLSVAQVLEQESRFRDYWIAQPGAKGVKLDWPATWRNWVRRSQEGMR